MWPTNIFKRVKTAVSRREPLTDEAIEVALKLDYEGFVFRWRPSWAHARAVGILVVSRRGVATQFTMERPRTTDELLSVVRERVMDWMWQDFTEAVGLKRENRP